MLRLLRLAFVSNYRTKLTALVLAVVIWGLASLEVIQTYRRDDIFVDIVVTENGVPIEDVRVEPPQVRVSGVFRCPRRLGDRYFASGVVLVGKHRLESPRFGVPIQVVITREDLGLPSDVAIVSLEPKTISVVVRRLIEKRLKVAPRIEGIPAEGFEVLNFDVDPTEVTVVGPVDKLLSVDSVETEPISLQGRSVSFSGDYKIADTIDGVPIKCDTLVRVRVWLKEKLREMNVRLPLTIVTYPGYPYKVKVVPSPDVEVTEEPPSVHIRLTVRGPFRLLSSPNLEKELKAYVEIDPLAKVRDEPYYCKVRLLLPSEMSELSLARETEVKVLIVDSSEEESR